MKPAVVKHDTFEIISLELFDFCSHGLYNSDSTPNDTSISWHIPHLFINLDTP